MLTTNAPPARDLAAAGTLKTLPEIVARIAARRRKKPDGLVPVQLAATNPARPLPYAGVVR